MFRRKYWDSPKDFYTEAGTDIVPVFCYDPENDKIVEIGKRSIVDEIQSFEDSIDFNVIKKQLMCGNETIAQAFKSGMFKASENMYGDTKVGAEFFTSFQASIRKAIERYNSLPEDFRSNFANVDEFLRASDDTIKGILDKLNTSVSEQSADIVKSDSVPTDPIQKEVNN